MAISGACCLVIGLAFGAHPMLLLTIAAIWGASVVADSAQFSACVTELGDPQYIGTALTIQTCIGFLLTTVSIELISVVEKLVGWQYTFMILAPGPLFGCDFDAAAAWAPRSAEDCAWQEIVSRLRRSCCSCAFVFVPGSLKRHQSTKHEAQRSKP
jgi:hypothetical protein